MSHSSARSYPNDPHPRMFSEGDVSEQTRILEESENLELERMATVRTARGDEFVINLDKLACAVADLLSEERHEARMGWTLNPGWYVEALAPVRCHAELCEDRTP